MSKLVSGDCTSIMGQLDSYLKQLGSDLLNVQKSIQSFNDLPNDKMDGADFVKVKAHMMSYADACHSARDMLNDVMDAQKNANQNMESYCDERTGYILVQDDSFVDNVDQANRIKEKLEVLEAELSHCIQEKNGIVCTPDHQETGCNCAARIAALEKQIADISAKITAYKKALAYVNRLSGEDSANFGTFSAAVDKVKNKVTEYNNGIKEMTIKASVKSQLVGVDPTKLDLKGIRDSAVENGIGSYGEEYYNNFNADTNSDVGTVDSSVTPDGDNSGDTGAPATGDVSGIWGTAAAWILNR